ncbi:helix-turn-helix domain-containing protein [Chryseobacterium gambrini]|uniref:helix-turn-helix domain-containing protein n=1 Tax=Chryseobacterium gambrini TaxID=373672 RepID=UPI003D0C4BDD
MEAKSLNIGDNIKKFRELKGLTREQMADYLELSVSAYGNIERNKTDLTISRVQQIAQILEVEIAQILNFDVSQIFNIEHNEVIQGSHSKVEHNYADEYREKYIKMLEAEIERLKKILGER